MKARMMLVLVCWCCLLLPLTGCHSTAGTAAGGAAAGFFGSETYRGVQTDLETKKQELIELYNAGVASGMEVEKLDELERRIYDVQLGQQGLEAGKEFLFTDWSDPEDVGTKAVGLVALLYAIFERKKLAAVGKKYLAHKIGTERHMRENADTADTLYSEIGNARRAGGVS